LTTAELLARSPRPECLPAVLTNEKRKGRIERRGDGWRIVPEAFPADLLAAAEAATKARHASGNRLCGGEL
jgi:hypothetical protein